MNAIVPARFDAAAWLAVEPVDNKTAAPANRARTPYFDTRPTVRRFLLRYQPLIEPLRLGAGSSTRRGGITCDNGAAVTSPSNPGNPPLEDYELIAQKLSDLSQKVSQLEHRMTDVLMRLGDIENVDARLEDAALTTARALEEISGHWDAVYEAMRRRDTSLEASEG